MHHVAEPVAEDLNFDMAGIEHRLFDQQLAGAEGVFCLAAGRLDGRAQLGVVMDQPHASAAAARGRLDHDRQTDLAGFGDQGCVRLVVALVAGHAGHACGQHMVLRGALVAHGLDGSRIGPHEHQSRIVDGLGKLGAFREKAIAGVDGLGAAAPGRFDDAVDQQIAVFGGRGADMHGLIGLAHVQRVAVGI